MCGSAIRRSLLAGESHGLVWRIRSYSGIASRRGRFLRALFISTKRGSDSLVCRAGQVGASASTVSVAGGKAAEGQASTGWGPPHRSCRRQRGPASCWPMAVETRYARSGEFNIAYQVVGEGPVDLVYVPGWVSNIGAIWDEPSYARFLSR